MKIVDELNETWARSPLGMKLLGLGALVGGAGNVAISTAMFRDDPIWVGFALFVSGAAMATTGYGLLMLKRWAWWMAMTVLAFIYLWPVLVVLVAKETDDMVGPRVIGMAIFAVVPLYLIRKRTRLLFGIGSPRQ